MKYKKISLKPWINSADVYLDDLLYDEDQEVYVQANMFASNKTLPILGKYYFFSNLFWKLAFNKYLRENKA